MRTAVAVSRSACTPGPARLRTERTIPASSIDFSRASPKSVSAANILAAMIGIDTGDGRAPIAFETGRKEMLFERDLLDHLILPVICPTLPRRFWRWSSVPYRGDPVSKREPSSKFGGSKHIGWEHMATQRMRTARASSDKSSGRSGDKSQVQVIARAAAILRVLEDEMDGLSLGQIAQRVNLARSTVQRIVGALAAEKFLIAASPTGRVRLGPTILRLAASARTDFVAAARPFLIELSNELKETADLGRGQERSPRLRRSGHRLAAAAHRVGGRRDFPALLHGERQGLSRRARRCRRCAPDRHDLSAPYARAR